MHLESYTFVALDLETTGLSPESDTIIEIAAIRYEIERVDDVFKTINTVEHSQLIHPGRPLTQEITMITGITAEMLEGKPNWDSVRDRVREFIGDAVIVGHNVLFDIAMLASHGIDLRANRVIDTFELSEIFSQDIESLNLGFLAGRYGLIDPSEDEHRALTDTKVSIRLFLRYLGEVERVSRKQRQIWDILSARDESRTLATISDICHVQRETESDISELFSELQTSELGTYDTLITHMPATPRTKKNQDPTLIEINNSRDELILIRDTIEKKGNITLVTPGYRVAAWMSGILNEDNIENIIAIPPDKWCSVEYMRELMLSDRTLGRKEMILTLKIAYWMMTTTTGFLDEMKFYGQERHMLDIYRCRETESNIWRSLYESKVRDTRVLIVDAYHFVREIPGRYTLIKDIPLIEDIVRRKSSEEIGFDRLHDAMIGLRRDESLIHMSDMISMIRGIYEAIPDRPTGPLSSPPGDHGETYFITQSGLWHSGHKWLIHATRALELSWRSYQSIYPESRSRRETIDREMIDQSIKLMMRYHSIKDIDTNAILSIQESTTKITLIPRSIVSTLYPLIYGSSVYGNNISRTEIRGFLMREYGMDISDIHAHTPIAPSSITPLEYHASNIKSGTVILTTSLRHARDLGSELRRINGKNRDILIQGLSGGKGKMLSLFTKNIHKTILIVIMDSWRDEYALWGIAEHIIIAKLPFDPPTDPYFLARTVGMSNNFGEYSGPIVTIRINTLIDRILSSGYGGIIYSADTRLSDTEWGKKIQKELL